MKTTEAILKFYTEENTFKNDKRVCEVADQVIAILLSLERIV